MIKFVVAALWICAVTVGAVFYSFQAAGERKDDPPKPLLGGLDYISTNMMSVPIIRNSAIQGYFVAKLVYTVEPAELAKLSVPALSLITDEVYTYLYANPQIDLTQRPTIDLDQFRKTVRDAINARVGSNLVHEILIDQMRYLSQDDIRDNAIKRRRNTAAAAQEQAPSGPLVAE